MMNPFDPFQFWRDSLTKLEREANEAGNESLKSPEFVRAMQQISEQSLDLQQTFQKTMAAHWRRANLPSRQELQEVLETLQRVETKIDRLLPSDRMRRPARTRKPPVRAEKPAAEPEAAEAAEPAPQARPEPAGKSAAGKSARKSTARKTAARKTTARKTARKTIARKTTARKSAAGDKEG